MEPPYDCVLVCAVHDVVKPGACAGSCLRNLRPNGHGRADNRAPAWPRGCTHTAGQRLPHTFVSCRRCETCRDARGVPGARRRQPLSPVNDERGERSAAKRGRGERRGLRSTMATLCPLPPVLRDSGCHSSSLRYLTQPRPPACPVCGCSHSATAAQDTQIADRRTHAATRTLSCRQQTELHERAVASAMRAAHEPSNPFIHLVLARAHLRSAPSIPLAQLSWPSVVASSSSLLVK